MSFPCNRPSSVSKDSTLSFPHSLNMHRAFFCPFNADSSTYPPFNLRAFAPAISSFCRQAPLTLYLRQPPRPTPLVSISSQLPYS